MNRRQIATKLALDELGLGVKLDSFEDRLILQKTIYILQTAGVKLGYSFSWYLKGPYSRGLTSDAFTIREELESNDSEGWTLDRQSLQIIRSVKSLLTRKPKLFKDSKAKWLELLASVRFLVNTRQAQTHPVDQIVEKLASFGKHYRKSDIRLALSSLQAQKLL